MLKKKPRQFGLIFIQICCRGMGGIREQTMLPVCVRCVLVVAMVVVAAVPSQAIDDALSYKSLVLGSLASGQVASGRVSSSSCHNYYMNITEIGYSLVVDLNTSSSALFLLVKASPILRHSLEDEHNYANYYQFKKQGNHHGVVVTSEHLSPGRWYIGVCNYVQDPPTFDEKKRGKGVGNGQAQAEYAEYMFIPTLNRTRVASDPCGPECQEKETEARLLLHERTAPELAQSTCAGGTCAGYAGLSVDVPLSKPPSSQSQDELHKQNRLKPVEMEASQPGGRIVETVGEVDHVMQVKATLSSPPVIVTRYSVVDKMVESSRVASCPPCHACEKCSKHACRKTHATWAAISLAVALVGMFALHQAYNRQRSVENIADNTMPSPSSRSFVSDTQEELDRTEEIFAQLADAKRTCEALERELAVERQAARENQSASSKEAFETMMKDLTERLLSERERSAGIKEEASRWRAAAEEAQRSLTRAQRDKEAAQRAAEVLEEEVYVLHNEMLQLQHWQREEVKMSTHREEAKMAQHREDKISARLGLSPPSDMRKMHSRSLGRLNVVCSGGSSPMNPDAVFSSSSRSFSFGGSSPAVGTPTKSLGYLQNSDSNSSMFSHAPHTNSMHEGMHTIHDSLNAGALAAFMGTDADERTDLYGELEPPSPSEPSPGRKDGSEGGSETRARGRRGGQRRKRAAGDAHNQQLINSNNENAATDSLATSMALAAIDDLSDND